MYQIAFLQLGNHCIIRLVGRLFLHYRLMEGRIEGLFKRFDRLYAEFVKNLQEISKHQIDALDEARDILIVRV